GQFALYAFWASRKNTPRIFGSGCVSRVASRQCLEQFFVLGPLVLTGAQPDYKSRMVTDDRLTARSAYVKTLVSRPAILTRKNAVLAIAAAAAFTTFGLLNAQQPAAVTAGGPNPAGANASKYNIAVVDISYIFKKHERFKTTM